MLRAFQAHCCGAMVMSAAWFLASAPDAVAAPPSVGSTQTPSDVSVAPYPTTDFPEDPDVLVPAVELEVDKALADPPSNSATDTDETSGSEVIHERFPSRQVKIERYVAQDADGNYFNHGSWTQWDEKGRLVARGNYLNGKRHGKWFRTYDGESADLFSGQDFQAFERPLATTAEFVNGELHGVWKVSDASKRPVCEWTYVNGKRDGRSVWYDSSGQIRQEVDFKNGQMDGELRQRDAEGKMVVRERYLEGRRITLEVAKYPNGQKKSQGEMLSSVATPVVSDDWWTGCGQSAALPADLPKLRHGHWVWWHPNGQRQLEGKYENDMPVGPFTWWFPNGQRQLTGAYEGGVQDGKFVWWYSMGQKQREGDYAAGVPIGNWMQWTPDGKVVQTEDYRNRSQVQAPSHPENLESIGSASLEKDAPTSIGSARRARN